MVMLILVLWGLQRFDQACVKIVNPLNLQEWSVDVLYATEN